MARRFKQQFVRAGYNKFGFKITKPRTGSTAPEKAPAKSKPAASPASTLSETGNPTVTDHSEDDRRPVVSPAAREVSADLPLRQQKPILKTKTKTAPQDIMAAPEATGIKQAVRKKHRARTPTPDTETRSAPSKKRKPLAEQASKQARWLNPESTALVTTLDRKYKHLEAPSSNSDHSMRYSTPHVESGDSSTGTFQVTPAYLRQLRDAVALDGRSGTTGIALSGASSSGSIPRISQASFPSAVSAIGTKEASSSDTASGFIFISTPPKLSASSEQYDEYVVTTTYRVPRNGDLQTPVISVSVALPSRSAISKPDKNIIPVSDISQAIEKPQLTHGPRVSTAAGKQDSAHSVTQIAAGSITAPPDGPRCLHRKEVRSRMPTPFHRGSPFHRLTPTRHTTPARNRTPIRRTTTAHSPTHPRPRASVFKSTTPRRKEQWKKLESNMAEYQRRRHLFPRSLVFTHAIKERITLPRLETFWKHLSDLIARQKLFARAMWEHWEYIGPCVSKVNERLGEDERFEMEESCAAMRELQRHRLVMFTGGGKVMLTRNAV